MSEMQDEMDRQAKRVMKLVPAEPGKKCDQLVVRASGLAAVRTACGKPAVVQDESAQEGRDPKFYCDAHARATGQDVFA